MALWRASWGAPCRWVKPGRFGNLFVLCCLALWRILSPDAFVYKDLLHTQTPRICHIFVLSLRVSRSTRPRNAYFSWQTLNCQIVPILPSYLGNLCTLNMESLGFLLLGSVKGGLSIAFSLVFRARERHIKFEHINFLNVGTTLGQPAG